MYQAELERGGFTHKLEYRPGSDQTNTRKKGNRRRKITWFNPPYSMDVETNVGKEFLKLLDLHFPPGHILRSVMCRSAVKVSYRCLPNMGAQVAKQNAKNMKNTARDEGMPPSTINCQKNARNQCPIPGFVTKRGSYTRQ